MSDERREDEGHPRTDSGASESTQQGEPGRTPGSAEGDRETVEESLREEERDDQ